MKRFTFVYQPVSGGSDCVEIEAKNQGIAIAKFQRQVKALKIIKIVKECKKNGKRK